MRQSSCDAATSRAERRAARSGRDAVRMIDERSLVRRRSRARSTERVGRAQPVEPGQRERRLGIGDGLHRDCERRTAQARLVARRRRAGRAAPVRTGPERARRPTSSRSASDWMPSPARSSPGTQLGSKKSSGTMSAQRSTPPPRCAFSLIVDESRPTRVRRRQVEGCRGQAMSGHSNVDSLMITRAQPSGMVGAEPDVDERLVARNPGVEVDDAAAWRSRLRSPRVAPATVIRGAAPGAFGHGTVRPPRSPTSTNRTILDLARKEYTQQRAAGNPFRSIDDELVERAQLERHRANVESSATPSRVPPRALRPGEQPEAPPPGAPARRSGQRLDHPDRAAGRRGRARCGRRRPRATAVEERRDRIRQPTRALERSEVPAVLVPTRHTTGTERCGTRVSIHCATSSSAARSSVTSNAGHAGPRRGTLRCRVGRR